MSKQFVWAALWLMLFAAPSIAQPVDLQPGDGSAVPATPALSPQPYTADQAIVTSEGCGCQSQTLQTP
jgi:hypothetical protein